jgi:hypothetical protein
VPELLLLRLMREVSSETGRNPEKEGARLTDRWCTLSLFPFPPVDDGLSCIGQ